jgi:hypothetical protein
VNTVMTDLEDELSISGKLQDLGILRAIPR